MSNSQTGRPLTVAVTSGKGGVGKSQLIASLAVALKQEGHRTLLVDADIGCGNLDVLFNFRPERDLRAVLSGECSARDVLCTVPVGDVELDVLPAPAANRHGSELAPAELITMVDAVREVGRDYAVILVDTGAGVSRNPMMFGAAADRIMVVANPEPTSLRDAYTAVKVLHDAHGINRFELVVNMSQNPKDGKRVYRQLVSVVEQFLPVEVGLLGVLPADDRVMRAVRARQPTTVAYPQSAYSHSVRVLMRRLLEHNADSQASGQVRYFEPGAHAAGTGAP
ncbi:MAG: hypothetical protein CMP23_17470 [Rickettsiales bacterium]|nr:hypothetical protein [Rickettsiales bacterium]|tara:strand:- start:3086 stop:3928 length:843 start_codon:yes stop_codon:yes gene_type:complete